MTPEVTEDQMSLADELAPPMANGDIVFEAPWQRRTFGMARTLCEKGLYEWDEFRVFLIEEIRLADETSSTASHYHYFDCFLAAFQRLLAHKAVFTDTEMSALIDLIAARPHGHDH